MSRPSSSTRRRRPTPRYIEAALRAGKAVWTEKPIAQELADTAKIVDLWRETGLPVQVGFMRRFDPGYVRAKELIDAGTLGRIEQFRALSRDTNPPPLEFLLTCGGSFLDMSVHDLDVARFLVGEVEEVHAWASVLFDDRFAQADDWDTSVIMMKFRNGALGVIETARHSKWGYDIRAEVAGAVGKVVVDGERKTPATYFREVATESDLYGDFMDRFEIAYRRELEVFFEDLGAGRTPKPGPGRRLRDAAPRRRLTRWPAPGAGARTGPSAWTRSPRSRSNIAGASRPAPAAPRRQGTPERQGPDRDRRHQVVG